VNFKDLEQPTKTSDSLAATYSWFATQQESDGVKY